MKTLPGRRQGAAVLTLSLLLTLAGSALAQKIQVVTSVPDLADITRQIGKDRVAVTSLTLGVRDMHSVQVKPSMASRLSRADVLVVMGLDLEYSFLPAVLDVAANPRISPGGMGYIDTSDGVVALGVPETLSRTGGDVHPMGNPHYNLDPVLGKRMAENIAEGLSKAYAEQRPFFMSNLREYLAELDGRIGQWRETARVLDGVRFVSYHGTLDYFARRFGMRPFGTLEAAPGIGPTPAHIVRLVKRMKEAGVLLVVYSTYPQPGAEAGSRGDRRAAGPRAGVRGRTARDRQLRQADRLSGDPAFQGRRGDVTAEAPPGRPLLALREASLGYSAETVLDGVDLEIHAGDFVGLSGPNGSGKTTLLRSLLGLLPLRAGRTECRVTRSRLGYVPQSISLDSYFPLSVREVVSMAAYGRLRPWQPFPGRERKRAGEALEQVGLAHLARAACSSICRSDNGSGCCSRGP